MTLLRVMLRAGTVPLLLILLSAPVLAQSGTRGSSTRGSSTQGSGTRVTQPRVTPEQFAASFWKFLTQGANPYRKWDAFPGREAGLYEGESPHGAFLRMYANSVAAKDGKNVPHGSIIVKENYGEDKATLMAITVMYRSTRFDPANKDWYYIKYNPDGTVAKAPADKGGRPIYGRAQSCINCHAGAAGDDFVFAND